MNVHILQHVAFEGPGHISVWAKKRGYTLATTHLHAGQPLPKLQDFDLLIIMGGPMNIYEDHLYPWLHSEKKFIRRAIEEGKVVVGICLGAQLLADALGSRVYAGKEKEIGWLPISATTTGKKESNFMSLPESITVFHWHGDTFDIPHEAVHLAASEGCNSQAFLYQSRVLGLQFHLESTPESVRSILEHCRQELRQGRFIQSEEEIIQLGPLHYPSNHTLLEHLLDQISS